MIGMVFTVGMLWSHDDVVGAIFGIITVASASVPLYR
jgi:hypothetical protein